MPSSSVRNQIVGEIVALLGGAGAPAEVYRARLESFTTEQLPAYNVFPIKDERVGGTDSDEERKLIVRVECLAAGATEADLEADPLYVFAVQQILSDPTLGHLATFGYNEDAEWTLAWSDQDIVALRVDFCFEYRTTSGDPTAGSS